MDDFFVDDFQVADYEQVMKVWEDTGMGNSARGDDLSVITKSLEHGAALYVLKHKTTVVGTAWITNDSRRLYLHHFGIIAAFRGQHLSHLLMKSCIDYAKKLKMQIKLEVHKNNTVAENLYKNYGFKYLGDYNVLIIRDI